MGDLDYSAVVDLLAQAMNEAQGWYDDSWGLSLYETTQKEWVSKARRTLEDAGYRLNERNEFVRG